MTREFIAIVCGNRFAEQLQRHSKGTNRILFGYEQALPVLKVESIFKFGVSIVCNNSPKACARLGTVIPLLFFFFEGKSGEGCNCVIKLVK